MVADPEVLIVSVVLLPAMTLLEVSDAVSPLGRVLPVMESETVPAEPLVTAVLMVLIPPEPWARESVFGLALIEKSFGTGAGLNAAIPDAQYIAVPNVPVKL